MARTKICLLDYRAKKRNMKGTKTGKVKKKAKAKTARLKKSEVMTRLQKSATKKKAPDGEKKHPPRTLAVLDNTIRLLQNDVASLDKRVVDIICLRPNIILTLQWDGTATLIEVGRGHKRDHTILDTATFSIGTRVAKLNKKTVIFTWGYLMHFAEVDEKIKTKKKVFTDNSYAFVKKFDAHALVGFRTENRLGRVELISMDGGVLREVKPRILKGLSLLGVTDLFVSNFTNIAAVDCLIDSLVCFHHSGKGGFIYTGHPDDTHDGTSYTKISSVVADKQGNFILAVNNTAILLDQHGKFVQRLMLQDQGPRCLGMDDTGTLLHVAGDTGVIEIFRIEIW